MLRLKLTSNGARRLKDCLFNYPSKYAESYIFRSRDLSNQTSTYSRSRMCDQSRSVNSVFAPFSLEVAARVNRNSLCGIHQDDSQFPRGFVTRIANVGNAHSKFSPEDNEINKEAKATFEKLFDEVLLELGGLENIQLPKEIVWLNGAPGAGKGANTPFILKTRGFHAKSIQMSDLLLSKPEVVSIMKSGGLVSDNLVFKLLLEAVLSLGKSEEIEPDADHGEVVLEENGGSALGAVVDGFPRTTLQVDLVKLLYDKLMELHNQFLDTPDESRFPRPIFRIAVLYVEEEESVRRQLARGQAAIVHNQRVADSGVGTLREVRPTDLSESAARRRYQIFREHYDTLLRLRHFFPFHLIDSMGTLSECREQIEKELQYQSALELDATTFKLISHIPLSSDIAKFARQNMVSRLDHYEKHNHNLFKEVLDIISEEVIPIIRKCALSGFAVYNPDMDLFFVEPVACEMLADILSERGYSVTWQVRSREVPIRVDRTTFEIVCEKKKSVQFRVKFQRPLIRSTTSDSATKLPLKNISLK